MKTLQEIFDTAYLGLAKQGFEPSMKGDTCMYRCADGRKCAVGHLIPDEQYDPSLETNTVYIKRVWVAAGIPDELVEAVGVLQHAHDKALAPAKLKNNLSHFAELYGLTIPQIEGDK